MAFVLVVLALACLVKVFFRRLVRGRRRPAWGLFFEAAVETARTLLRRAAKGGPEQVPQIDPPEFLAPLFTPGVGRTPVMVAGRPAEWLVPRRRSPSRTLLYLHGGGYVTCSIATHRELMSRLAVACDARVLALEYRLAPAHPFPAALDDARAAVRWLADQGVSPQELVVAGDSAGGGLTLALLQALREAREPLPAAAFLISPWVDLLGSGASMQENGGYDYIGGLDEVLPAVARLYLPTGDLRAPLLSALHAELGGLPPLLFEAGGAEVLRDQIVACAGRAKEAGVDVTLHVEPDMVHVWHAFASVCAPAARSIERIGAWVQARVPAVAPPMAARRSA